LSQHLSSFPEVCHGNTTAEFIELILCEESKEAWNVGDMNNVNPSLTPAMQAYLIGSIYRNTRSSCLALAFICPLASHDALLKPVQISQVPRMKIK
jgi:hypothetical protein